MSITKEERPEIYRRNGAKSRGPLSPEVRLRVARNPVRHGFLARTIVLKNESMHRFNRLAEQLRAEFAPVGPVETGLVENMILARWRKLRLVGMERAAVDRELQSTAPAFQREHPGIATPLTYRNLDIDNL